jgi:hypothetical protein
MLSAQLKKATGEQLLTTMNAAHAVTGPEMLIDEINGEIKAARRERREQEIIDR